MLVSVAASKNSCAHVTADHEVSVKTFAEELKTFSDITHVFRSEPSAVDGHTYPLMDTRTRVRPTVDVKGFDVGTMRRVAQMEHSAALSSLPTSLL